MENKAKNIISYLRAGFSAFWISTPEPHRVEMMIGELIKSYTKKDGSQWEVKAWRCTTKDKETQDPVKVLEGINALPENTVILLHNFHWFLEKNKLLVQIIQDCFSEWANAGKAIVVISSTSNIPLEVQKYFTLLELPLPNEEELKVSMTKAISESPDEMKPKNEKEETQIIKSARGLTTNEAENVFALSLIEHGKLSPETIGDYKAQIISKSGFLTIVPKTRDFSCIKGLNPIKQDIRNTINDPKSKGSLLIGPPGTGKTTILYGIAGEFVEKIVLKVIIGKLFSKYHGETDANVDYVINLFIALAGNLVVILDEFEKQFSGVSESGDTDSGVTKRANSRWLDFFQDRPEGINVYGTANSFENIPPEYLRAGRWDTAPYYVGMPNAESRQEILEYYLKKHNMKKAKEKIKMDLWSGADIEALVHNASMRNIPLKDAVRLIRPQAITHKEQLEALEAWAKTNAIPAEDAPVKKNGRKLDV